MKIFGRQARYSRVLLIVNALLGLAILIAAPLFIRDLLAFTSMKNARVGSSPQRHQQQTLTKSFQDYEAIAKNNPFGFPGGQLKLLSGSKGESSTSTNLRLIGTIVGPQKYSYAVFTDGTERQEIVRTGMPVLGDGKLSRVDRNKAFVQRDGRLMEIPLIDVARIEEVNPSRAAAGGPVTADFVRSIGRGSYIVDQKTIFHALENPNQLMTDARLQPNVISGKQEGFVLREVRSGGIYQSLGLQNGDVLLRINNYDISSPDSALQAFTALRGMDRVSLDIVRNNAKMTMTYQIR